MQPRLASVSGMASLPNNRGVLLLHRQLMSIAISLNSATISVNSPFENIPGTRSPRTIVRSKFNVTGLISPASVSIAVLSAFPSTSEERRKSKPGCVSNIAPVACNIAGCVTTLSMLILGRWSISVAYLIALRATGICCSLMTRQKFFIVERENALLLFFSIASRD